MTIIDGLTLQLKHAIGSNDSKKKKKKIKKVRPLDVNPDDPTIAEINLFPKNNIGKYLASWVVRLFPGMNIELRQTTIVSAFGNTTTIEYLKLTMRARSSRKSIDCMSFKTGLYVNTLLHHIKPLNDDSIKPFQIGGIALENKFSVNFKTGILDDLRTRLNIHDGDFSVFNAAKYYIFIDEIYKEELPPPPILTPEELKIKQENKLQRFENFYRTVHAVVSEINVHLETIKLLEIPFVTMNNNADIRHYFNDLRPATCLELVTKSVSFNFSKMRPDAAGFEVLFNSKKQKPYHLTCSVQLLKIYFSTRTVLPTGYDGQMSDEILNVPNFALTYKTNILEQLVRGKGFENCVVEIYFSASTPIFDLDTRQLSALLYNLILVKKWKKLHEFRDLVFSTPLNSPEEYGEFDETQTDSSRMEFNEVNTSTNSYNEPQEKLKSKIWRYLNEYYPRLDIKMVVEQPRIVLRHYEPHKNTQILTFSYSLLNFSLTTTPTRDYATSCQVLYPKTTYHEKSNEDELGKSNEILVKEICHMNYIDVKVDILKNLKVKGLVDFNQLTIDLTNLEIFTGIHYLLLDVTSMVENDLEIGVINKKFNYELLKLRHELKLLSLANPKKPIRNDLEEKIFKYLPHWMTKIEFKLNSLNILLGSRSVLIPKNDLASSEKPDFSFDFDEHHELRQVNFKIESFNLAVSNNGTSDTGDVTPSTVSSTASSETLASLTQDTVFWSVTSKLEKLKMSTLTDFEGKFVNLLDIPSLKTDIKALCNYRGHNKLNVTMNMEKLNIDYNRYKFCTLIGTVYLIREFVIAPIKLIKNKIRRDLTRFESLVESTPILHQHSSSLLDFLNVDFKLDYSDIIIRLTDEFKAKLQVSQIQAGLHNKNMEVMVNFIRGLADSPQVQDKWCRLLCLDTLKTKFRVPSSMHDLKLDIETDAIRFIQPHQFVVYKLFDNISITVKLVKHLIKLLKDDSSKEELNIVPPHTQKPKSLPFINVKSKHLKFCMEDDPFETELGMIYQLGLVEQRKRLELYSLFETKSAINRDDPEEYFTKLNRLHTNVSQSWIRKVKTYKAKLRQEIINNKEYLFGHEIHLDESLNNNVVAYPYAPPLVAIYMDKLNLDLSKPKFDLHHLPDFINRYGQGTPKDTKYTLLIPLFLNLQMSELRMHLRDYPLPILHSPRNKDIDDKTFTLKGHLIITEAFVDAPEHIRRIDVPLVPHKPNITLNKYEALVVEKTLASVKMYTNLECGFRSNYPTRIIWGTSYNFGIQQLMLNFDKFSKPPVDPSTKLGFWDKLKYVLHGKCTIKTKKSLEVGFKGSRDPYDLFAEGGGFVLSFRKNVVWDINKDDDSRNFFDVTADKVSWYIPNYLGGPLLVWTRNSTESVYLPDSPHMISSCYAYYLGESQGKLDFDYANNVFEKNVINLSGGVHYQVGFLLQRDDANGERTDKCKPHYEVQLYNPEYCKKGHDSYDGFRSEYIHMAISLKSSNESSYNTIHLSPGVFVQLFSWWKLFASNLQLPIRRGKMFGEPKSSVKFSQHLFTNKFSFNLKSLFIAHVYRDEIIDLHNDKIECVGLRAKVEDFIVDLHQRKEPRTVYHEELSKNKKIMKMNFDLGEVNMSDIDLRVMHVTFYQNLYTQTTHGDERQSTFKIFDNDKRWFDSDDFEEVFLSSIEKCARDVEIFPLTFLQRFSYERDTHDSIQPKEAFGREDIHECTLGKINPLNTKIKVFNDRLEALEEQLSKIPRKDDAVATDLRRRISFLGSEIKQAKRKAKSKLTRSSSISDLDKAENYHNKFTLLNTLLKWNFDSRNLTMQYIHFVKLRSAMRKYLSHESIETLEKIMDKANAVLDSDDLSSSSTNIIRQFTRDYSRSQASYGKDFTSQDRISNYNDILREKSPDEEIVEDYLIDIVAPQIQLQSEDHPDSVVLISAPAIKGKILSIVDSKDIGNQVLIETRYGVLLQDANVFVLNKDDLIKNDYMITSNKSYGAKSNWPPWLGPEIARNSKWAGENNLLIEKLSVMILCYESEILSSKLGKDKDNDDGQQEGEDDEEEAHDTHKEAPLRFEIDMPSIVITSTSSQYFTLYIIIVSLLFYSEPMSKVIQEKIEKLKFSIDFEDLNSLTGRLAKMQQHYRLLRFLTFNYNFRQDNLNNEDLNNYLQLNLDRGEMASDIYLLLRTLLTGDFTSDSSHNLQMSWLIMSDEIILELLEDDRTPIMDVALARGMYKRKVLESGTNINRLHVGTMKGFNLIQNAKFPDLIQPLDEHSFNNLIEVEWTMNKSVGGIKVVENVMINAAPLNIKVDEETGEKLMNFIFHTETGDVKDSKIMAIATDKREDDVKKSENDDAGFGLVPETDGINKGVKFDQISQNNRSLTSNKRSLTLLSTGNKSSTSNDSSEKSNENKEDIQIMIDRSKEYFSIISLSIKAITLMVTLKLRNGFKRVLNVSNFKVNLPELNIQNEILSFMDVTKILQKTITKLILSHIGKLLANKLSTKKAKSKQRLKRQNRVETLTDVRKEIASPRATTAPDN